jgi:hypothetical protein
MESYKRRRGAFQVIGQLGIAILAPAIIFLTTAAAADRPELIPAPLPLGKAASTAVEPAPDVGLVERIVDLARFLMILCDDQPVPVPLLPEETVFSMSAHLTPEGIDLLEKHLTEPEALALVRKVAPEAAQLLPVLAAGAPLVRGMHPEIQVIVARQRFDLPGGTLPRPIMPAFAVVFQPKDVSKSKQLLLSTYWGVIASANELAKQQGRSRLKLNSGKRGEAFFASAKQVDPPRDGADREELFRYNFSPAIGIVGERFIISTGAELGSDLVDLARSHPPSTELVHGPRFDVGVLATTGLVLDNLALLRPNHEHPTALMERRAARVAQRLREAVDTLPDRPRRIPNLLDRLRDRRLARAGL